MMAPKVIRGFHDLRLPQYSRAPSEDDSLNEKGDQMRDTDNSSVTGAGSDSVPDSEVDESLMTRSKQWPQKARKILPFPVWKLIVILLSVWGTVDLSHRAVQPYLGSKPSMPAPTGDLSYYCRRNCGKTMEEALSRGCVWDELEFRFTRPECINKEVLEDFAKSGPGPDGKWLYAIDVDWTHSEKSHGNINDGNMTIIDSNELIPYVEPGRTVWHSNLWHISHCLWYWRKVSMSRFDGTLLPMARAEEAEHGYHCTRMIINYLRPQHLTDQYKTSFSF